MTTTDTLGGSAYPPPPLPPASGRLLRRSRSNRVAAGVSSGLGQYFGVDPVLFRVLFATSAFFAGAGILAYLIAWVAIPEEGTARAPIDGWVGVMRRRRFPLWLAVLVGGLFVWIVVFSWWAPGPFFPVLAIVLLLVVFYGRRDLQSTPPDPAASAPPVDGPVNLSKEAPSAPPADQSTWVNDARAWFDESVAAHRERRRRARPVRLAVLLALVLTLTGLGIADAVTGIEIQVYFWTALAIVGVGLLVGIVLRRTPLSMAPLLVPALIGAIAFAGSHASLHDGVGQREWKPTTTPAAEYRLALGQGTLDLRQMPTPTSPVRVDITAGAGQVKVIAPKSLNLTVLANIHFGQLDVDPHGRRPHGHGGTGITRTVDPPAGATGAPVTVDIHLADGNIRVEHH